VAPIESKFRTDLLRGLGFDPATFPDVTDRTNWPAARRLMAERIASRTRDDWAAVFDGSDACATPVLSFAEAQAHPAAQERNAWVRVAGHPQPAPAPRFSATPTAIPTPPQPRGAGADALDGWGITDTRRKALRAAGIML